MEDSQNKLNNLTKKLEQLDSQLSGNIGDKRKNTSSLNICSDLIAGIFVGGAIGFYLDKYFNTRPIFFIICFLLGNIASGMLIYRNFKD